MKKLIYILLILSAPLSGCKKFLDTNPTDFLSPVTYYETEEQLKYAIAGVYDILGLNAVYGTRLISYMTMEADEGYYVTTTVTTGTRANNFTASDPDVEGLWAALYNGINRANIVLENVDKNPSISQTYRDRIRGEALFLRGYYYFMLANHFGGVPLRLASTKGPSGNDLARSDLKTVYAQIIQDMETAETLVPAINQVGFAGRVSKSAVRGILARVNLYMASYPLRDISRYEEVKKWATLVIDDTESGHRLNPDFTQIFINLAQDKYDIKESIWEVEFWGNAGTYRETGQVGSWIGISSTNATIGTAYGFIQATAKLYRSFENNDLRRDWSIAPYVFNANATPTMLPVNPTNAQIYSRDAGKYRREYEVVTPKSNQATPINWPLLRYSDILLMHAEALHNTNKSADAVGFINQVRRRGYGKLLRGEVVRQITVTNGGTTNYTSVPTVTITGGAPTTNAVARAVLTSGKVTSIIIDNPGAFYTSTPTVTITGGGGSGATATAVISTPTDADIVLTPGLDLMEIIRDERSRELCYEGMRKSDLIRWNIYEGVMNDMNNRMATDVPTANRSGFANVTSKHKLFPIPTSELVLNRAMTQNEGWN